MKRPWKKSLAGAVVALAMAAAGQVGATNHNLMTVFKNPSCGCCGSWAEAMRKIGFEVRTVNLEDLSQIKKQSSVPQALEGCHTAVLGDYILEGHVPAQAIAKLLQERPQIRGISTPGMPAGSLGMGYDPDAQYTVFAFYADPRKAPVAFYQAGQ